MLDETIVTEKKKKMEFPPIPEDVYQVELFDITSKRVATYDTKNKPETEREYESVFDFQFVLLEGVGKDLKALRGRNIWRNYVPNYFYEGRKGKNISMQIVEAINNKKLTDEDCAFWGGKDWNSLVGRQVRVLIETGRDGDKTYDNIKSFLPIKTELEGLTEEEKEKSVVKKKEGTEEVYEKEEEEIEVDIDAVNNELSK